MRVVYFVSLFPCWSETFIVREMKALMAQGVDVHIVSLRPHSELMVQDDARGLLGQVRYPPGLARQLGTAVLESLRAPWAVSSLFARVVAGLWRKPSECAKTLVALLRTLALMPDLRALDPDRVHAHWATYPSTAALLAGRLLQRPFSFTSHAHDIWLHDHLMATKLATADVAVTISDFNRRWLLQHHGAALSDTARAALKVVHCGVPIRQFAYRAPAAHPTRRLVLAVGRLDPIKGFEHLVEACGLLQRRGVDFECCIVGDGPLRASLQAQAARLHLDAQLRFAGVLPQAQVQQLLGDAAVFALPCVVTSTGDRDGIPVALMEAMAQGVPVVSTQVSGIPELVEDAVTGRVVPPGDAAALADAIGAQLADREAAQRLALAARARVEAAFDIDTEAARLLAHFRAAARKPAADARGAYA
jgi:colanic acid/amylovoran biosynthesis glycosyltransferase